MLGVMKKKQRRYLLENAGNKDVKTLAKELGLKEDDVSKFLKDNQKRKAEKVAARPTVVPEAATSGDTAKAPSRFPWFVLGIFALSLALRLLFIHQIQGTPLTHTLFVLDADYYKNNAMKILEGNFFYNQSVYGSPLYPFFLALVLFLGKTAFAVQVAQAALDSASAVLIFFICRQVFGGRREGLAASLAYALYGLAVFYAGLLLDVTLLTFLYLALMFLLLKAAELKKPALWAVAGVTVGLILALKTSILLVLPALAVWFYKKRWVRAGQAPVIFFAAAALTLLPFCLRNQQLEGRFSPFPTHGGLNFYIGNHEGASGKYAQVEGISDAPIQQINDSIFLARRESGKDLSPADASGYWMSKALDSIGRNPTGYAALMVKKVLLFWNWEEVPANTNFYFVKQFAPVLNWPLVSFGVVAPFALLGLLFLSQERSHRAGVLAVFVLAYMASVVILFVTDRYRFPSVPFVLMLAAFGACRLYDYLKRAGVRRAWPVLAVLAGLIVLTHYNVWGYSPEKSFAVDHNNLGNYYAEEKKFPEAFKEYEKSIALKPDYMVAYFNLADALDESGDLEKAAGAYKKALEIDPKYADARYNLSLLYRKQGKETAADEELERIIAVNPYYGRAYFSLGNAQVARGNTAEAIKLYQKAVEVNPHHAYAHFNLGKTLAQNGDLDGARREVELLKGLDRPELTAELESLLAS